MVAPVVALLIETETELVNVPPFGLKVGVAAVSTAGSKKMPLMTALAVCGRRRKVMRPCRS
jgi:hypothetical protein